MRLAKRGAMFVAVPPFLLLILSAVFTIQFLNILTEVEKQSISRDFVGDCYGLESKIIESFCELRMSSDSDGRIDELASRKDLADLEKKVQIIATRAQADPSKESLVSDLTSVMVEVRAFFEWFTTEQSRGADNWRIANKEFPPRLIAISDKFLQVFSALIQSEQGKFSPERTLTQWNAIKTNLHISMIVIVLMAIALGISFTLTIKGPLSHISETCRRIASKEPPTKPLSSQDELGELDRLFHSLGKIVDKALADEKAMVENARDLICTLNSNGEFLNANSYSLELIGLTKEELLGRSLIDICGPDETIRADDELRTSCSTANMRTFDLALSRIDGGLVDTRWSCVWSERDDSLFAVVHDISEEKNVERLKQDFVDMISHDLRSPLTSMLGSLSMIAAGAKGPLPDPARSEVDSAVRNVERLVEFINDLLDFQKLKAGRMQLELAPVDLKEIVDGALEMVKASIETKNLEIVLPRKGATVNGDRNKLTQVAANLMANAVRYSPQKSSIEVQFEHLSAELVEMRVVDSGPGVPEEYREQIFEAFTQVPSQNSNEGTGLGLAICKLIVNAHGGQIGVRGASTDDPNDQLHKGTGSGSIFWIRLARPSQTSKT